MSSSKVVQARAHAPVPPLDATLPFDIGLRLIHGMRIIDYHVIAPFARPRSLRHDHAITGPGVFKTVLLVLIVSELKAVAPALLIPRRFDEAAASNAVARGQRLFVTAEEPPHLCMGDPDPSRPKDRRQQ